jgi:uncharacterized protein involved in exopolysaccharide biosynthesis
MDNDQRLTPLPASIADLQTTTHSVPSAYSVYYDDETLESKRSIRQYFNVIYKRLPIILALTLIVTSAVALYMFKQPHQYMAVASMLIEPPKPKVTDKDSININFGTDVNYSNTQLQLLQSPELMKDVVVDLGLYRDPNLFGSQERGLLAGLKSLISRDKTNEPKSDVVPVVQDIPVSGAESKKPVLTPEEESRANTYTAILAGGLSVEPVERTNIVRISVKSDNPGVAAKVADRLAELFKEQDAARQTAGARQAYDDLNKSIDALTETISRDEAELIAEMKANKLPLLEKGQELSASRLGGLSETWMKSMENRRQLEARYTAAVQASSRGEGMNIPDIADSKMVQDAVRLNIERQAKLQDDIRSIDKQIQELVTKKEANAVKWREEHPEMKAITAQIDALKAAKTDAEKEVARIVKVDKTKTE